MIYALKTASALGVLAAAGWFAMEPDFIAVLVGIVSLSVLMMAFLPIAADKKI